MEATDIIAHSVDKSQVPPLHQKRILAFVNHFLIQTCTFLNEFTTKCEGKFIELERKMQKVDASLTIIEAKLASIPDAEVKPATETIASVVEIQSESEKENEAMEINEDLAETTVEQAPAAGLLACEDERYKKYFKMLQFGVPIVAVKLKVKNEGLDANVLDTPNIIIRQSPSC